MQLKLDFSYVFLSRKIILLIFVIHIVRLEQKSLRLLEEVIHLDLCNKVRIKIVVDALCFANPLLYCFAALFLKLEKDDECICL